MTCNTKNIVVKTLIVVGAATLLTGIYKIVKRARAKKLAVELESEEETAAE